MVKNRLLKWWIVVIIAIPFLLMFCLHVGIALGNYFDININAPNIDAEDWFMFMGSYLGGVMTLAGVMITLKHERNAHQYEKSLESIEKEKDNLGNTICELNIFAPSTLYQRFNSLPITSKGYNSLEIASVRQQLAEEMQKINTAKLKVIFFTDIFAMTAGCSSCKKLCRIQTILPEFQKIYERVGNKIFSVLQMIDSYIVVCESNALYQALINNCQQSNQQHQLLGQPPQYDETTIKEYESKIVDIALQRESIHNAIIEVSNYNQVEIPQLSSLAREYIAVKQQNARKKCFPERAS